jgi:hypothetical protein
MKLRIATAIVFVLIVSTIGSAQESDDPVRPIIAEVFLAKANSDGLAGEPAENFVVSDVPIFCVVRLHSSGVAAVKMDLVATKVPGVKPDTKVVSISYTTKANEDRVNFSGKPHDIWTAGMYRVDIYVGEKKVRIIEFEIKSSPIETAKPSIEKPRAPSRKPARRPTVAERYAS